MSLDKVRAEITEVDTGIIRLIARRQELAGQIAKIKIGSRIPVRDEKRAAKVLDFASETAAEYNLDPVAVRKIFEILIAMSEDLQKERSGECSRL
jgi:chorismate mutase